jgi:hypothetical protein
LEKLDALQSGNPLQFEKASSALLSLAEEGNLTVKVRIISYNPAFIGEGTLLDFYNISKIQTLKGANELVSLSIV